MRNALKYASAGALALASLLVATAGAQQLATTPQALSGLRGIEQAPPNLRPRLEALRRAPGGGAVRLARISPASIRAATVGRSVQFNLAPGLIVSARATSVQTEGARLLWRGQVAAQGDAPAGQATLVVRGDNVTGTIHSADGRVFRLRPLGGGETAISELDYARLPPDHPAEAARSGGAAQLRLPALQPTQAVPPAEAAKLAIPGLIRTPGRIVIPSKPRIDVLVAYTSAALAAEGGAPSDILDLIALAVEETSGSFANSSVNARVHLAGTMQVSYNENAAGLGWGTVLNELAAPADGKMDNVHPARNAVAADVVVLVINKSGYCGLAAGIAVAAPQAFALVDNDCATGYYSFAHEMGHLVGARHDPANDASAPAYAHGYQHPGAGASAWRTIMAYACGGGTCDQRIQYWSTPLTNYNGAPVGTAAQHDNRRRWNERAAAVAAFR